LKRNSKKEEDTLIEISLVEIMKKYRNLFSLGSRFIGSHFLGSRLLAS